jgi:hypothetical protein
MAFVLVKIKPIQKPRQNLKTFRLISNPKHKPNYAFSRNTFRESLYVLQSALAKLLPLLLFSQHIYVFISF